MQVNCRRKEMVVKGRCKLSYKKKAARPRRPARLAPEAAILGAAPLKGATGELPVVPVGAGAPEGMMVPGAVPGAEPVGPAGTVELPYMGGLTGGGSVPPVPVVVGTTGETGDMGGITTAEVVGMGATAGTEATGLTGAEIEVVGTGSTEVGGLVEILATCLENCLLQWANQVEQYTTGVLVTGLVTVHGQFVIVRVVACSISLSATGHAISCC